MLKPQQRRNKVAINHSDLMLIVQKLFAEPRYTIEEISLYREYGIIVTQVTSLVGNCSCGYVVCDNLPDSVFSADVLKSKLDVHEGITFDRSVTQSTRMIGFDTARKNAVWPTWAVVAELTTLADQITALIESKR